MSEGRPPARHLSSEILSENPNLHVPLQDVEEKVQELRSCGLSDDQVRNAVVEMFTVKDAVDKRNGQETRTPEPEEILVYSVPSEYTRKTLDDWR